MCIIPRVVKFTVTLFLFNYNKIISKMDISTKINANNSKTKPVVLKEFGKVKTEIVSEENIPVNEDKSLCLSTVENQFITDFKIKKENINDELENSTSGLTFKQGYSSRIKDEYNEEMLSNEDYDISENQRNVEEFSENSEVDEKIDISEIIVQSSEYEDKKIKLESENQKEFTKRQSPDDDPKKQGKQKTERSVSVDNKNAKITNCQFCNNSFARKQALDEHMLKQHKREINVGLKSLITSKIYTCNKCNSYETTQNYKFHRHINSVHNEEKIKIKCRFCMKSFKCKRSLDEHVLKKHKDNIKNNIKKFITRRIHVCKICNSYETTHKSNLDHHLYVVHNEGTNNIICPFCNQSFTRKSSLDIHIVKNHKLEIKGNLKSLITNKIHTCIICNSYETTNKAVLYRHIDSVHNKEKIKNKCQFCSESFVKQRSLEDHVLKKHKDKIKHDIKSFIKNFIHKCNICNTYETTHKSNLNKHINSVHNEVKDKRKCQFCTKSFVKQVALDRHLLRKHKDKIEGDIKGFITSEIYSCRICSFETLNKTVLERHVNSTQHQI